MHAALRAPISSVPRRSPLPSATHSPNRQLAVPLWGRSTAGRVSRLGKAFYWRKEVPARVVCSDRRISTNMATRWWNAETVAVVTGANKGIGYEIARSLAEQGVKTVVTARNVELGQKALQKLHEEGPPGKLLFHQLDISSPASVDAFAAWLEKECGGVTILVNNAGMAYKGDTFGADEAATTLATNFHGTMAVCERLKPLLKPPARIINVSSRAGLRSIVKSAGLLKEITSAKSKEDLAALAERFVADIRAGQHAQRGWPSSMYGISKLLESQYTQLLAEDLKASGVMVNAMCPGWCATDMSSWRGTKTAADGADTAVWLALRPPQEFETGGFYGERAQISW